MRLSPQVDEESDCEDELKAGLTRSNGTRPVYQPEYLPLAMASFDARDYRSRWNAVSNYGSLAVGHRDAGSRHEPRYANIVIQCRT
jgi:hypothetical protein